MRPTQSEKLEEIVVKAPPVSRKGDTVNYTVQSFAQLGDRSIADVLRRMPGIEVSDNGTVLYQGKPINKYYIEGLDLLGGKYNLANQNLPHRDVAQIQILENHQPLKVLDTLQFSDKTALNIKLRNKYAVTGQAITAAGLSPLLWNGDVTPMIFTPRKQILISYQTNNTGIDLSDQLKTLTIEDLVRQVENNAGQVKQVTIQNLNAPSFSDQRWLDNQTHLLTINYLQKLKSEREIKINLSYLNDHHRQIGFSNTLFFTPTDTIPLSETIHNRYFTESLEAGVTLQKNTRKNFWEDSLQFQGKWNSQSGDLTSDKSPLTQKVRDHFFTISNRYKRILSVGKHLLTFASLIRLSENPQSLMVDPGPFSDLLNGGLPFEAAYQNVGLQSFYTKNSVAYSKGMGAFSFLPEFGVILEKQQLKTKLTTSEKENLPEEFSNALEWQQIRPFMNLQAQFKKGKWRSNVSSVFNYYDIEASDAHLQKAADIHRFAVEPSVALWYDLSALWSLNALSGISQQFSTIDKIHYAFILNSYRKIDRTNTPLGQTQNRTLSSGIS